jgi:hypothetical protein
MSRLITVFFVLFYTSTLFGWWDVPHMLVCQIAKNQLDERTIHQVEEVLAYFHEDFPESSTFVTASCFPDDITTLGLSGFKVWHGVLKPYSLNNFLTDREKGCIETLINDNNLHAAIRQSVKTLKNPEAKKWERSFMMRFLLHCVADIHQPLHCVQLYSPEFPHGDLAGHRFITNGTRYKNLHLLWDAAFGIGDKKMVRPLSLDDETWICEQADLIEKMFPEYSMPESTNMDYIQWSNESYLIATQIAYHDIRPYEIPSSEYLATGQRIALRQIALAGYRLAGIIKQIFN